MTTLPKPAKVVGRYTLYEPFAQGGMATVHLAHVAGSAGFMRVVAVKRMLPEFLDDAGFVAMFQDEATLAARVAHPNVVPILDVVRDERELMIVMEYVRGVSLRDLATLLEETNTPMPVDIVTSIVGGVLEGLHAAHGARGDDGWLLGLVHRDVSPQNILVGTDGVPRLVDFGVAKAVSKLHVTGVHEIRGKLRYMAPERVMQQPADLRVDVYSAGIVLWELLANRRRYVGDAWNEVIDQVLKTDPPALAHHREGVTPALDRVIARATARSADARYASAEAMLADLEAAGSFASKRAIATWLARVAEPILSEHEHVTKAIRASARASVPDEMPVGDEDPTYVDDSVGFEPLPERHESVREMALDPDAREDATTNTLVREPPVRTARMGQTERLAFVTPTPVNRPMASAPQDAQPPPGVRPAWAIDEDDPDLANWPPRADKRLVALAVITGIFVLVLLVVLVSR